MPDHSEKRVFTINVGNIPEDEIEEYIRSIVIKFKKEIRDIDTLNIPDCDIFIPEKREEL
jgi:hypothetical protein